MNIRYLLAAMCCVFLVACQKNEPEQKTGNQPDSEIVGQLSDFFGGIGAIVETATLQDGSVVMKDDKGNTITKDKDGNITIVTQDGETIYIDNSIKEDKSAPKDKWFHSTWDTNRNEPELADLKEPVPAFIGHLQQLGFNVEQNKIFKDSTIVEQKNNTDYTIHFNYTTASLLTNDTIVKYTYTYSVEYLKITLSPGEIGDGEIRYALVITGGYAELYERAYHYNSETGQYEYDSEWKIDELERYYVSEEDHSFTLYQGKEDKNIQREIVSGRKYTTWFNYRRLSDTQLAVSNNSASYLLNESTSNNRPLLKAYDLDGHYLKTFELVSL